MTYSFAECEPGDRVTNGNAQIQRLKSPFPRRLYFLRERQHCLLLNCVAISALGRRLKVIGGATKEMQGLAARGTWRAFRVMEARP